MRVCRSLLQSALLIMAILGGRLSGQEQPKESVREKFIGAWRLVSIETVKANGDVIYSQTLDLEVDLGMIDLHSRS